MKPLELAGKRFGRLLVAGHAGKSRYGAYLWLCHCDCGKTKIVNGSGMKTGFIRSCGCLQDESRRIKRVDPEDKRLRSNERRLRWAHANREKVREQKRRSAYKIYWSDPVAAAAKAREWVNKHKIELSEKRRRLYYADVELSRKRARDTYHRNKERVCASHREWRRKNKEHCLELSRTNYRRIRLNPEKWAKKLAADKEYNKKHREAVSATRRAWRERMGEELLAKKRAYYYANKNVISAKQKEYYKKNKSRINAVNKEYREKNKDKYREYRERNKDKINAIKREYLNKNRDRVNASRRRYYAENKDAFSARQRAYRERNKSRISIAKKEYYKKNKDMIVARIEKLRWAGREDLRKLHEAIKVVKQKVKQRQ